MYQLDTIDLNILNLLLEDGRRSASEISRRIGGLAERAVRYRIERMAEEKVMKIGAFPNARALGYHVLADVWLQVDSPYVREVATLLTAKPYINYVATAIGEVDIIVQVVAHSNEEMYELVTGEIAQMPGVRKTITSIVPTILKDVCDWRIPNVASIDSSGQAGG